MKTGELVCTRDHKIPLVRAKEAQHPDAKMSAGPFGEMDVTCPHCGYCLYSN